MGRKLCLNRWRSTRIVQNSGRNECRDGCMINCLHRKHKTPAVQYLSTLFHKPHNNYSNTTIATQNADLQNQSSCGSKPDWLSKLLCRFHLPAPLHQVPFFRCQKTSLRENPPATGNSHSPGDRRTENWNFSHFQFPLLFFLFHLHFALRFQILLF